MTDVFSRFGPLQSVELSEKPGASGASVSRYFTSRRRQCFRVAYIVFKHASGVSAAKRHPENAPLILSSTDRPVRTGIHKWIQQYSDSLIKALSLQQNIDQFMNDYDTQKEEEVKRQNKKAKQQQEDEEAWVKVTKGSHGVKVRPHSEMADERTLQKEKNEKERKELLNFYTWQHRNTQKEHIAELRKKFEEDKLQQTNSCTESTEEIQTLLIQPTHNPLHPLTPHTHNALHLLACTVWLCEGSFEIKSAASRSAGVFYQSCQLSGIQCEIHTTYTFLAPHIHFLVQ